MPDPLFPAESWIHRDGREMAARAREAAAERERQADRERQAERDRLARAARSRQAKPAATPAPEPTPEPPKRRTWRDLGPDEINRYALAESRYR